MKPSTSAQYTVEAGDSAGVTLEDLLAFVAQVEKIDPSALRNPLWCAHYAGDLKSLYRLQVRGGIPVPVAAGDVAAPEEAPHDQADPDQVETAAYAAKVLTTLDKVRAHAERWAHKENIDPYTAMRAICIDLGIDLHPDAPLYDDEDD